LQAGWGAVRVLALCALVAGFVLQTIPSEAAPAIFLVNATDDTAGSCEPAARHCTLRAAIDASNADTDFNTIDFDVPSPILPTSALPSITDPVLIDGYSQTGSSPNTSATSDDAVLLVVVNCNSQSFTGVDVASGGAGSTITGLVIQNCAGHPGIVLDDGSNTIQGNFLGTTSGGTDNQGNLTGIQVNSTDNLIGGPDPADRNLISGNSLDGIELYGTGNTVQGNFIGTTASGQGPLANGNFGVVDGRGSNVIGGAAAGAGNVISGNGAVGALGGGLLVNNESGPGSTIQGNLVGTSAGGTSDVGNQGPGIELASASNTVGGTAAGAGNAIAFNQKDGLWAYRDANQIVGNAIFSNGNSGVVVFDPAVGNLLSRNLIHSNQDQSIDLNGDGLTANDPMDPDEGANHLQNFPVLDAATTGAAGTTIEGSLNSKASTTFTLEFFSGSDCDALGRGQSAKYLGSKTVTTDSAGDATFTAAFATQANAGDGVVTSTATDPSDNTSEMSECANLVEPGSIAFTSVRSGNRDIFLMNGDGTNPRRLTKNPAADYQPTLAPTQIVFVSNRDGNRELYSMNLSGHNVSRLTSNPAGDFEPSVGPSGQIAFTSNRNGNREVYLLTPSGGSFSLTRLTSNPAADYDPSVGADGSILFVSNRSGHREIYKWRPAAAPTQLTEESRGNFEPSAGAGDEYAFTSLRDGNREVYQFAPGPGSFERLTNSFSGDYQPAINGDRASDGFEGVVFVSLRAGNREIYLFAQGTPILLTNNPAGDFEPSWMAPGP
jgi:hypothetical protein